MPTHTQINYEGIDQNIEYENTINEVLDACFNEEKLNNRKLYINIILTTPENIKQITSNADILIAALGKAKFVTQDMVKDGAVIKQINKQYRNVDNETDVLSFPMFEKDEIEKIDNNIEEVLGDIVISIARVEEQAKEYGHSFTRELAYMVVHGFYHIIGYDHIEEEDKKQMRKKEEVILNKLNIRREL